MKTYPELCRRSGRALLVVIAGEVGGRWSDETKSFLWFGFRESGCCDGEAVWQCMGCVVQTMNLHAFCSLRVREFAGWIERVTRSW